jgi:hypothetical protein
MAGISYVKRLLRAGRSIADTMTDDALLAAYRRTRFCADTTQGRIVIRVSESHPELDAILRATGLETWAYVTAFNPGSVRQSDVENDTRQRELEDAIRRLGHPMFAGEGIGDDRTWPPERSVLVLGIEREAAVQLGRRFGQRAIVCGQVGGLATLALCD